METLSEWCQPNTLFDYIQNKIKSKLLWCAFCNKAPIISSYENRKCYAHFHQQTYITQGIMLYMVYTQS